MIVRNALLVALSLAVFAVVHSLLAGTGLKSRLKPLLGERLVEGWYRLAYNLLAAVTILPALVLLLLLPDRTLYEIGAPWSLLMRAVQALGLIGLAGALFVTDVWDFIGISQALAFLTGGDLPRPTTPLVRNGMYRVVRHPLYFFSLVVIWFNPTMTANLLAFNIAATLYLGIGSLVEERRLERLYGEDYRAYRERVSWLIPWFPRREAAQGGRPETAG